MATGRVLQFDEARGYGFVAADDGGEDVFLHASVFDGDSSLLVPGVRIEFQVMAGDRGRKAFAAHLTAEESDPAEPQVTQAQQTVARAGQSGPSYRALPETEEEQLCDVLSPAEFRLEITELLLRVVPPLTGDQILVTRQSMLEFARKHSWVDG